MTPWDGENARDFFVEGQIIKTSKEGLEFNKTRKSKLTMGRVFGFSKQMPWCIIVLRDGVKYPERFSGDFWEPA